MRAVIFEEFGDPDVVHVAEIDAPVPAAGQIRITTKAAGFNPLDWKVRSGAAKAMFDTPLPWLGGYEAAGVVDALGDGVTDVAIGDEVFGPTAGGAFAEAVILDAWTAKPAAADWNAVAGLPVAAETSVRVFNLLGGLAAGQTIAINGAAGGVGAVATQLAVARGATVIGTAGESNLDYVRSLGAQATTYGDGMADRIRALAPEGIDLGFDVAGHGGALVLAELTGDPGNVASIADFAAAAQGVKVTGGGVDRAVEAYAEAARLLAAGKLTVTIAQVFSFDQAAEAHRISESGHVRGKLILTP